MHTAPASSKATTRAWGTSGAGDEGKRAVGVGLRHRRGGHPHHEPADTTSGVRRCHALAGRVARPPGAQALGDRTAAGPPEPVPEGATPVLPAGLPHRAR